MRETQFEELKPRIGMLVSDGDTCGRIVDIYIHSIDGGVVALELEPPGAYSETERSKSRWIVGIRRMHSFFEVKSRLEQLGRESMERESVEQADVARAEAADASGGVSGRI